MTVYKADITNLLAAEAVRHGIPPERLALILNQIEATSAPQRDRKWQIQGIAIEELEQLRQKVIAIGSAGKAQN